MKAFGPARDKARRIAANIAKLAGATEALASGRSAQ
jgi:hypothetical protein